MNAIQLTRVYSGLVKKLYNGVYLRVVRACRDVFQTFNARTII